MTLSRNLVMPKRRVAPTRLIPGGHKARIGIISPEANRALHRHGSLRFSLALEHLPSSRCCSTPVAEPKASNYQDRHRDLAHRGEHADRCRPTDLVLDRLGCQRHLCETTAANADRIVLLEAQFLAASHVQLKS